MINTAIHEEEPEAEPETAQTGIIVIDGEGTINGFNQAAVKIFGYAPEEITGKNFRILIPLSHRALYNDNIRNYLETGTGGFIGIGHEVMAMRKDGAVFPMEITISEIDTGRERLLVGAVKDISGRKADQENARIEKNASDWRKESAASAIGVSILGAAPLPGRNRSITFMG